MGRCYGGVNTFLDPVSDPVSRAERALTPSQSLGSEPFPSERNSAPLLDCRQKIPAEARSFSLVPGEDSNLHGFTR